MKRVNFKFRMMPQCKNIICGLNNKFFNRLLLLGLAVMMAGSVWGATTYTTGSFPTTGWSTSGGSKTLSAVSWTYSSSTYIGAQATKIQIGSSKKPQTSNWTIQTAVTNFGAKKKVTSVAITAYTTETTATYDISVNGTSVKSGSLTTSSATYTASNLNYTSGDIVITLKGSSTSKAMYLSNITVVYEDATSCTKTITISKSSATLPTGCSFSLDKSSGCGDGDGESVVVTCTPADHYSVTAVSSTSGSAGTISDNKCTVSGIKADATISVTFTQATQYTIQFTDGIHSQTVDSKQVYAGETFDFPTITDRTEKTSGTCEEVHYHFMGWVISTHAGEITAGDIKTGTSEAVSAAATYKAVWAAKDTSK